MKVYGEKKFDDYVHENPSKYLAEYSEYFNLSFLDENKKLSKFSNTFEKNNSDVFFIQEYSKEF